ncbi:hypothetical protein F5J12DRAFT_784597 [Pisolithus orientalis]|uniref:uncharacterized protein n=1 Tax=Pisolithus orientalis TaxID=936130 RepID=UPI0022256A7A|nr:uncharacterized protein F5J12DRAFT_784597 [Pisolithus orientalis]KAI5999823.1 hypothetical protein F5J12DRAFT_784597 [Pisolithus orientalis]
MAIWGTYDRAYHSISEHSRACHGPPEHTAAHVLEQTIAFQSTLEHAMALWATPKQMPEQTVAHGPEHAMALQVNCGKPATLEQMPEHAIVLWATLEQIPEHTAAHVPEHTIAFQSTPEQAMALWEHTVAHAPEHTIAFQSTLEQAIALQNKLQLMFQTKLWHGRHSGANSGANCGTYA